MANKDIKNTVYITREYISLQAAHTCAPYAESIPFTASKFVRRNIVS